MQTTVIIIGGGQAGLAMSRCLTDLSIDHVVLERSQVANSWRTERWDSLRLLTPNWLTRLPGWQYRGSDPDGYMKAEEVVDFLEDYGRSFSAPVQTQTTVSAIKSDDAGFVVTTNQGEWHCHAVVVATGASSTPKIPAVAAQLPARITQLSSIAYKNSTQIDKSGTVLVVGASASGVQIANELQRSGHKVTMAVGEHVRVPRSYRGMDIYWWMETIGVLDDLYDEVEDLSRARRLPSLQLAGSSTRHNLDLNELTASGVQLVGRFAGINGTKAQFSGSLANNCAAADLKQNRLLDRIDEFAVESGLDNEIAPIMRPASTVVPTPTTGINLSEIVTVIWATGFKPDYPWLEDHLLDPKGAIRHNGGVMQQPGMYVLGLPFTRRRKSIFLDGVGPDALELSTHLHGYLDKPNQQPASVASGPSIGTTQ